MGNRRPKGIGIDTASIDYGQSSDFMTHQIMGKNNVWGLENLNNLNGLPHNNFEIFNMVHKLREGSGGPSRVIAVLHPDTLSRLRQEPHLHGLPSPRSHSWPRNSPTSRCYTCGKVQCKHYPRWEICTCNCLCCFKHYGIEIYILSTAECNNQAEWTTHHWLKYWI